MDIIIGEVDYLGKGYGTDIVKKFVDKIFRQTKAVKIIIDPDSKNIAAIHCFEKVGFEKGREFEAPDFWDYEQGTKLLLMELKKK